MLTCITHLSWGTGRPTSVDRDGLPQPYVDLGSDYSFYIFGVASRPISTSHQLTLVIDIVWLYWYTWVEQPNLVLNWFMNNIIISYKSHLIITQIRSGFYIYILERSFCLMLYNFTMIQHYSRCVIRQLLWLRSTYPHASFTLGLYMWTLQWLSANWIMRQSPDRHVPDAREIYHEKPITTNYVTPCRGPEVQGGYSCIKRSSGTCYSMECHTCTEANGNANLAWCRNQAHQCSGCRWIAQSAHTSRVPHGLESRGKIWSKKVDPDDYMQIFGQAKISIAKITELFQLHPT